MNINWSSYDSIFFQSFCNALLSLEVSKSVVPFSAEGRDGGIDGLYSGQYDNKSGHWRFQDKFHKTARKVAYNSLKTEITLEIEKLDNEDHFIILTNVGLLPKERTELLFLGTQELARLNKGGVNFDIWDDAKIHTLYINHPILRLWMEEGFTTAQLLSYKNYFGKRLEVDIEDPSTLANEFIARESDLKLLSDFTLSEAENIVVISGEAGIGKTRLAIEFFKSSLDKKDDWLGLVLNSHRINIEKLSFVLSGNTNILILVDDAHNYAPEVIADLRNLLRIPQQRRLKFILTGRRVLIDRALAMIPIVEDNSIKSIPLAKLSKDETRELFEKQRNIGHYKQFIPQLVATSNGRPILIVALLRAIQRNVPLPQIKDQDVLKDYVRDYFSSVVNIVSEYTGSAKYKIENLLRLICLLEPLPINKDEFYARMALFVQVEVGVVKHFLTELLKEGLAIKRYDYVVSPDYYSDIMLATADQQIVISSIEQFAEIIPNIILNLSAVDEAYEKSDQNSLGLDQILAIYISELETGSVEKTQSILHTMSSIAYQKPEFAKAAIVSFVSLLNKNDSARLRQALLADINNRSVSQWNLYGSVSRLLHDLLYRQEFEVFVFETVLAIHKHVPDLGIFKNTFGLDRRHIIPHYNFKQQDIFVTEVFLNLNEEEAQILFFIDALKDFLNLEITVSTLDPFKNGQINITTYYLTSDPIVVAFRRKVIDALIFIYKGANSDDIKKRIVHELIDIPRGISASTRSKNPYKGVDEILYVLEFIDSIAENMPLSANREVIDRLYWITKWGADEKIVLKIADLKKSLQPKSLPEKILFLLNNAETRVDHDYEKVIAIVEEQARVLISEYESAEIAESVAQVRAIQSNHLEFLWTFNRALHDNFPTKAVEVYDRLWQIDKGYVHIYGSGFLHSFRFKHHLDNFFWEKIKELEDDGSPEALNVALYVYHRLAEPVGQLDCDLVFRIYWQHKEKGQISFNLLMALATVGRSGFETTHLIEDLFDTCPQRSVDNFLTFNRDIDSDVLKRLILHHSIRLQLTFEIQHAIASLLERHLINEEEFFTYFLSRFQLKQQQVNKRDFSSYEFAPHENFNLFSSFDESQKATFYIRAVQWYVDSDFEGMDEYYAKDLLEFLKSSKEFQPILIPGFDKILEGIKKPMKLHRLIAALDVFETKTKALIDFIIKILNKGAAEQGIDLRELQGSAFQAITSVGVKMASVGEPFAVDVQLRSLINEWIANNPREILAINFLNNVVKSLDEQIKRSSERDETIW